MTTPLFSACGLVFQFLVFLHLAQADGDSQPSCPKEFPCVSVNLSFPFSNLSQPDCGLIPVDCPSQRIELGGHHYNFTGFVGDLLAVSDPFLQNYLDKRSCKTFNRNSSFPNSSLISFRAVSYNLTLFKCSHILHENERKLDDYFNGYESYNKCDDFSVYYTYRDDLPQPSSNLPGQCSVVQLPVNKSSKATELFEKLVAEITLEWTISQDCLECHLKGGHCLLTNDSNFYCSKVAGKTKSRVILIVTVAAILSIISSAIIFVVWCRKKKSSGSSFSKRCLDGGSKYLGLPVFSYSELEKVTNNFSSSTELGDGGFGTVYYGKLQDGREVAVKRLYEQNFKTMEQFINEIEILTSLRHRNLVTLYGCTSRNSHRLLLVYEYIPNGTLADHLHGDRANYGSLTWPIRMNIAVETATALAYLHASGIIHRDVKTANILLDNNFCVKVADFGLSRLFPNDATHVSTAPQGTPGYVDPDYHECFQLTDKSDVYSFGVVLIELISSLPAVDIRRRKREINLANFAINKMLRRALNELIDPHLGLEMDTEIKRMTTSVAELAFRCLQPEKDMRPTMYDTLETLKKIQYGEFKDNEDKKTVEIRSEDIVSLKRVGVPTSPNSVTEKWACSTSTATSNSG